MTTPKPARPRPRPHTPGKPRSGREGRPSPARPRGADTETVAPGNATRPSTREPGAAQHGQTSRNPREAAHAPSTPAHCERTPAPRSTGDAAPAAGHRPPGLVISAALRAPTWAGRLARELALAARDHALRLALDDVGGYPSTPDLILPRFCEHLAQRTLVDATQLLVTSAAMLGLKTPTGAWAMAGFDPVRPTRVELAGLRRVERLFVPSDQHRQAAMAAGLAAEAVDVLRPVIDLNLFQPRQPAPPMMIGHPKTQRFAPEEATPDGDQGRTTERHAPLGSGGRGAARGFRFLVVASPVWRKGLDLILPTYLQTFRPPYHVELVLVLTHLPKLKKQKGFELVHLRQQLGAIHSSMAPVRVIVGVRTDRELAGIMASSDLLVIPSRRVHSGRLLLEAAACALPAVAPAAAFAMAGLPPELGVVLPTQPGRADPDRLHPGSPATDIDEPAVADLASILVAAPRQRARLRQIGLKARRHLTGPQSPLGTWTAVIAALIRRLNDPARAGSRRQAQRDRPGTPPKT